MAVNKYQKQYLIRSYECDKHQNLRLLTLMNILQDSADGSADILGVGYEYCVKHNLAWVAANYHVKIFRAPKIHEDITIYTWPSEERKLGAIRDYELYSAKGELLVQASTQWVLIDFTTKRPQSLRDNLPFYDVLSEKADNYEFTKLLPPEQFDFESTFAVRFDDIDVNNHVNNAVYPLWISEAVPTDFRNSHTAAELEIAFKKPAIAGEEVVVKTALNGEQTYHQVFAKSDGRELARAQIKWAAV